MIYDEIQLLQMMAKDITFASLCQLKFLTCITLPIEISDNGIISLFNVYVDDGGAIVPAVPRLIVLYFLELISASVLLLLLVWLSTMVCSGHGGEYKVVLLHPAISTITMFRVRGSAAT